MEGLQIDLLTVFIAAICNMAIGMAWYSKWLFGPAWMELKKISDPQPSYGKFTLICSLIVSLVIAYFLAYFQAYLEVTTVVDGMFVGFCFWLGFVATTQISAVLWNRAPFKLFCIDTGFKLLSFVAMSGLIGA